MAETKTLTLNGASHENGDAHTNGTTQVNGDVQTNEQLVEAFVDGSVAISANTPELVPGLVGQVASLGKDVNLQDHKDRSTLLEAARSLVYALETPREAMIRYCWSQATLYAALETGVDLDVFSVLSKDEKPKTAAELAAATGADPVMLGMLLLSELMPCLYS
jgi:hypothetical protein